MMPSMAKEEGIIQPGQSSAQQACAADLVPAAPPPPPPPAPPPALAVAPSPPPPTRESRRGSSPNQKKSLPARFNAWHGFLTDACTFSTIYTLSELSPSSHNVAPTQQQKAQGGAQAEDSHSHLYSDSRLVAVAFHCILLVYYYLCVLPFTLLVFLYDVLSRLAFNALWVVGRVLQSLCIRLYFLWMVRKYIPDSDLKDLHFGPSFSFSGGGMLWTYYLGVAHHLYVTYDVSDLRILASSAGVFVAIPLVCGEDPYEWCKRDWAKCIEHFKGRALGTFFDDPQFYRELWDNYLPPDAHIRVSGRLFLSITQFPSFRNVVVSQFSSRAELLECILATMCLPIVFLRSFVRTPRHGLAIDGGITNDLPCVDRYTVTCSAINMYADIHPTEPFTPIDLIKVPSMEEVFEISEGARREAEKCEALDRPHWKSRLLKKKKARQGEGRGF